MFSLFSFIVLFSCKKTDEKASLDIDMDEQYGCHEKTNPSQTPLLFYASPYDDDANQSSLWYYGTIEQNEIIELGSLEIGRSTMSNLAFTPDGNLAFLATDDGKIQGLSIDENDTPTLLPAQDFDIYPSFVIVDSSGNTLWIVDENWPNNGGGIYKSEISCSGTLSTPDLLWESKNAHRIVFPSSDTILVTARELEGIPGDVFVGAIASNSSPESFSLFSEADPILSAASVSPDRTQLLLGENSEFSGVENRIVWQDQVSKESMELHFLDPVEIIAHPEGSGFMLVSGYGNKVAFFNTASFDIEEPSYQGVRPQLPGRAIEGTNSVFLSENQGIRSLSFVPMGIQDNGVMTIQTQRDTNGLSAIVGGLGYRPPNPNIWP